MLIISLLKCLINLLPQVVDLCNMGYSAAPRYWFKKVFLVEFFTSCARRGGGIWLSHDLHIFYIDVHYSLIKHLQQVIWWMQLPCKKELTTLKITNLYWSKIIKLMRKIVEEYVLTLWFKLLKSAGEGDYSRSSLSFWKCHHSTKNLTWNWYSLVSV